MSKILLINPSYPNDDIMSNRHRQPLCLAYIASLLRNNGNKVVFVDRNLAPEKKIKWNDNWDWAVVTTDPIDRWECPHSDFSRALQIVGVAKKNNCKTVLIGPHGTLTPELLLNECKAIDFLVRGEPEMTVEKIVRQKSAKNLAGVYYRKSGKVIKNKGIAVNTNLDKLPLPAYDLLDMNKYEYSFPKLLPKPFSIVVTSRGCPHKCIFCLKVMYGGNNLRFRSIKNVIKELELLINHYKIQSIYFQDLEFILDKKRVEKICQEIIKNKLVFKWGCAARVNDVDEELFKLLKKAGCVTVSFGVESFSPTILKNIKKGITISLIKKAYDICKRTEINFNAFYTEGHLGETKKTNEESIKIATKLGIRHPLDRSEVIPYPGTELYKIAEQKGLIKRGDWKEIAGLKSKVGASSDYKRTKRAWLWYVLNRARTFF